MKRNNDSNILVKVIVIGIILIFTYNFLVEFLENSFIHFHVDRPYVYEESKFNLISSSENEVLDQEIRTFARKNGIDLNIYYADTLDIMAHLNEGEKYDAVWSANSIWVSRLNSDISLTESRSMSINPVIFGIKKKKAEELGFVGKEVKTKDILDAISNKQLKFSMSKPNRTNSGAVAYLGILSTLAGNPDVLTSEIIESDEIKEAAKTFFSGLERTSGDEDYLEELFLNGDYEAVVSYESSIININKELEKQKKDPLYAIYPIDGVSISDSVLAYIDRNNDQKKEQFLKIQNYFLSSDGQKILENYGRRTWYGGTTEDAPKDIFNPKWGIDPSKYISPIRYPSDDVINKAFVLYQEELRKPIHVVFCLDYSGSMRGVGYEGLISSMEYILSEKAKIDNNQFTYKDKIDIIPFATKADDVWSAENGSVTDHLLEEIKNRDPLGRTALFTATIKALDILKEESNEYNTSVILMTDGASNDIENDYESLEKYYKKKKLNIPIFSITFGSADEYELERIAKLTNGKVFDGKSDLISAFREVRDYS